MRLLLKAGSVDWKMAESPLVELRTELRAELLQSFCRVLVELNVLKFVTWILPQLTARNLVSNQLEAGLTEFEF